MALKNKILILGIALVLAFAFASIASAQDIKTVCCEKTNDNIWCQDAPASKCDANFRSVQTSCASTSYCRKGTCYDSNEGTCLDNTPQNVCNSNNGTWSLKSPAQCNLGCCVLGDQAAFVTLVRCKKLASFLGLETNFKKEITNEVQCVLTVQGQEKGACIYEEEFEKRCKITTRAECTADKAKKRDFFKGKLCSAEELGTVCGPTTKTICAPGKEEVYFVDSCGNTANIYDAAKINDKRYWSDIIDKAEACTVGTSRDPIANAGSCGNCNYLAGSYCRPTSATKAKVTYGENSCANLNCAKTSNGKAYKHGESWCVYTDFRGDDKKNDSVGARFYKHICINGEEVLEQCADFRQHECIESAIPTTEGLFHQAGCRVNRWQDCVAQASQDDCENTDKRDCVWKGGTSNIKCVPKIAPGLKFWEGDEAKAQCAQASMSCEITYEKGLIGGKECIDGCECEESGWLNDQIATCKAIGDCGPKVNWVGQLGYKQGYSFS